MKYVEVKFEVNPIQPVREILVSDLADIGFESFVDFETGVSAFVPIKYFDNSKVEALVKELKAIGEISYQATELEEKNWNAVWESEYETVEVDNRCIVLAPFHKVKSGSFDYQVVINPKMSFGTGHHETTYLMLSYLLDAKVEKANVLDMGSGTGVLAILAAHMKANTVRAIDIEDWAFENTIENAKLNNVEINVEKGDSTVINGGKYDLILANINKNVLLADMHIFNNALAPEGTLFLSGFFVTDIPELEKHASSLGLNLIEQRARNSWASLKLSKRLI